MGTEELPIHTYIANLRSPSGRPRLKTMGTEELPIHTYIANLKGLNEIFLSYQRNT